MGKVGKSEVGGGVGVGVMLQRKWWMLMLGHVMA